MKKLLFSIIMVFLSVTSFAREIKVGETYISTANFQAKSIQDGSKMTINRENRFKVVKYENNKVILDVVTANRTLDDATKKKLYNHLYEVDLSLNTNFNLMIKEWDIAKHGALVVPFKLSFKDGTLSTKSVSLGYYLQYPRWTSSGNVGQGPIYSVGLTSITRNEKENTELGISASLGYVFELNDKFQIGALIGIDHLGDDTWKYEDAGWASLMIGFNFLQ